MPHLEMFSDHITTSKTEHPVVIEIMDTISKLLISVWKFAVATKFYIQGYSCEMRSPNEKTYFNLYHLLVHMSQSKIS